MNRTIHKPILSRASLALLLTISLLANCREAGAQPQQTQIFGFAFLPFQNNSDFTGKWDVGLDVPRFLAAFVKERYRVPTISPVISKDLFDERQNRDASIEDVRFWDELYRRLKIRYLIAGTVEQFDVSRFMTGQPQLGGYEAFKGVVNVTYTIYDLERTTSSASVIEIKKGEITGEYADRSFALTLFGKQSPRTVEYRDLDHIRFGSDDFNRSVIGQACFKLGEELAMDIEKAMPAIKAWGMTNPDSLLKLVQPADSITMNFKPQVLAGAIVFLEGESAFINFGSEDGIRIGDRVPVFRNPMAEDSGGGTIGELQVTDVRGPHLSLAKVLSGHGVIRARDKVTTTVYR